MLRGVKGPFGAMKKDEAPVDMGELLHRLPRRQLPAARNSSVFLERRATFWTP